MSIGITGFGAYVPRMRVCRKSIVNANAWYAPNLKGKAKGHRSLANWDEDSLTMAVAASRDLLGKADDRSYINEVLFASTTHPFADRLNAGIVSEALNLDEFVSSVDLSGSQSVALAGISQAVSRVSNPAYNGQVLLAAADSRVTRAGSPQELDYADGAAALSFGNSDVIADFLGEASLSADFVDHFRLNGEEIDYHWEERWVRDEGISKLAPKVIAQALENSKLTAEQVDYFIFPSTFKRMDASLAKMCGIPAEAVVDNMAMELGDTGAPQGLLMLASVLEKSEPNKTILLVGFGSGARAVVFRTTEKLAATQPQRGLTKWMALGTEETNYTRLLAYKGQLDLERGMRGEQDKKTALSTSWRHKEALLGLVGGKCKETGEVHFPPSRISYTDGAPLLDSQKPYPMAERLGKVMSWSAEYLSFHMAPPHHYGQVDFEGGGRILMEFTDVLPGEVSTGCEVEMSFRVKDIDEKRGYKRYFWKAVPLRNGAQEISEGGA